ncbi:unnamed protein product [Allacma fusca]|uniref:Uncharacterized protein n=1 Tax=Allacma fusca TaxID=39272 RepID=A0A8J2NGT4_9HEXA|nr:unnamed protein product [Allacma fusca]
MADPRNVFRGRKGCLTRYKKAISDFAITAVTRANYAFYKTAMETLKANIDSVYQDLLTPCADQDAVDRVEAEVSPVLDDILDLENKLQEWDTELTKKEAEKEEQAAINRIQAQRPITRLVLLPKNPDLPETSSGLHKQVIPAISEPASSRTGTLDRTETQTHSKQSTNLTSPVTLI